MANNASVITKLTASSYNGEFNYQGATGTFSADSAKKLMNINGSKPNVGNFDASKRGVNPDQWQYNPHFTDPTKAEELIAIMTGSIAAVQSELDAQ